MATATTGADSAGAGRLEEERAAHLSALGELNEAVAELHGVLAEIGGKVGRLSTTFSSVERDMDAVSLPFQSAVFDYSQNLAKNAADSVPTTTA
eukprot:CAMPEP_0202042652 /NCGR_PEP_ID=MMETSP0962-20130828/27851_1 /ASSEMBLY_ACC=CAM_ASM_000488 /TAXON_ID=4773 /ORGANISM="Schizochytrium aggregatum, Strain ATCC28209" /LENGTH=93 /DNA_ID=CAMNT_0048607069 /DNA_START=17 /DNA_END=298 /DNA_ORIENTATION=+